MGEENGVQITSNQKDIIYRQMLMPLKTKISQILLYDTKAALEFLQTYNEIIENEQKPVSEILDAISALEIKIGMYENSKGKEKAFEERNKAILQMIDELSVNSIQLSLEEFENRFSQLKSDYDENIQNYSFKDREKIERAFYSLRANLIMRQVAEGRNAEELRQSITEQDKVGLNIYVSEQINSLRQREDLKDVANKVSNIVMTDSDAILKPELWSWMNAAEKGKSLEMQSQKGLQTTSTALMVAPKNNKITFWNKVIRFFNAEPMLPLQDSDLPKLYIEWISKYIPKSMLIELEDKRLAEEGQKVDNKYVPDSKEVLYQFFKESEYDPEGIIRKAKEYTLYIDESGASKNIIVDEIGCGSTFSICVIEKVGEYEKINKGRASLRVTEILRLAELLDNIFNTDFKNKLLHELSDGVEPEYGLYRKLVRCYERMFLEYNIDKMDFEAIVYAKRNKFYENNKFKQQIKQQGTDDESRVDVQTVDETIIQHKENNNEGQEQGGL